MNARDLGVRAVLMQEDVHKLEHPLGYFQGNLIMLRATTQPVKRAIFWAHFRLKFFLHQIFFQIIENSRSPWNIRLLHMIIASR